MIYVDYGTTDVEVVKASGVDNIVAVRASAAFERQTNVTVVTQSGKFYTFNLKFAEKPSQLSFVVDPAANAANKRVALLDNKELNSVQRENLRKEINSRFQSLNKLYKDYAGIRFAITNIFIDKDILFSSSNLPITVTLIMYPISSVSIFRIPRSERKRLFNRSSRHRCSSLIFRNVWPPMRPRALRQP